MRRLNKEFTNASTSGICVTAPREEIKEKLKQTCASEDKVFVARKYCVEEKDGQYFCVKEGKCFGDICKGCLKHECETEGGKKEFFETPADFLEKHLAEGDFDKDAAVNVDDMKNVTRVEKWCTMIEDRSHCRETCRDFGSEVCGGENNALKFDHDDFCKRKAKQCKCCCQPVCKSHVDAEEVAERRKDYDEKAKKTGGSRGHVAKEEEAEEEEEATDEEDDDEEEQEEEEVEEEMSETEEDDEKDLRSGDDDEDTESDDDVEEGKDEADSEDESEVEEEEASNQDEEEER